MKRWLILCLLLCAWGIPALAQEDPQSTQAPDLQLKVTQVAWLNGEEEEAAPQEPDEEAAEVPQEAVIYTPNTGEASLREKPHEKGKLIKKCKGGTIVEVLEQGEKWTKIRDGRREGYIRTDCLKFYPIDREPIALADLSWRGTTTGGTRINIRNAPDKKSSVIGEWRTGTDVEVFSLEDGWYEVEAFGMHGFVMEEFVTLKNE